MLHNLVIANLGVASSSAVMVRLWLWLGVLVLTIAANCPVGLQCCPLQAGGADLVFSSNTNSLQVQQSVVTRVLEILPSNLEFISLT